MTQGSHRRNSAAHATKRPSPVISAYRLTRRGGDAYVLWAERPPIVRLPDVTGSPLAIDATGATVAVGEAPLLIVTGP